VINISTMARKKYVSIILCALGVIFAGIASYWNSSWNEYLLYSKEVPYRTTVEIGGIIILMAGIYCLTWPPTWK
jgi:hypothetical protein